MKKFIALCGVAAILFGISACTFPHSHKYEYRIKEQIPGEAGYRISVFYGDGTYAALVPQIRPEDDVQQIRSLLDRDLESGSPSLPRILRKRMRSMQYAGSVDTRTDDSGCVDVRVCLDVSGIPSQSELFASRGELQLVENFDYASGAVVVDSSHILSAALTRDEIGNWAVEIRVNQAGIEAMKAAMMAHIPGLNVMLDGEVLSSPYFGASYVPEELIVLPGLGEREVCERIAAIVNGGVLPVGFVTAGTGQAVEVCRYCGFEKG